MYVRKLAIRNIRSIEELDWEVGEGEEAGWHVILGDNGAGKSTVLRALALALLGPIEARGLRQDWQQWLRHGETESVANVSIVRHSSDEPLLFTGAEPPPLAGGMVTGGYVISYDRARPAPYSWQGGYSVALISEKASLGAGWFSASYGPFRRFQGGDPEYAGLAQHSPRLSAHLSLFGENHALTEALRWLQELDYRRKDQKPEGKLLDDLIAFINDSELLPHGTWLKSVSSDGVFFEDGNGCEVPVLELSDGYRSILSLTFDLIRQLAVFHDPETIFDPANPGVVALPGVVLIDEVDVHLHPSWQHRIGEWFLKYFPAMQFIVTTHSPIICQAAVKGSVWRLASPGSGEISRRLTGPELDRLLYGNVLDAYGTGVFGLGVTRSEAGKERLRQLAELNVKSLEQPLSETERERQSELRESTPTAGSVALEETVPVP